MPAPPIRLRRDESKIEVDDHFRRLCEKASKEQDPDKLLRLVQEIITYPITTRILKKVKENPGE
jgi:hypothetical protein